MSDQSKQPAYDPSLAYYENHCTCKTKPHRKWCRVAWLNDHYPDADKALVEVVESK